MLFLFFLSGSCCVMLALTGVFQCSNSWTWLPPLEPSQRRRHGTHNKLIIAFCLLARGLTGDPRHFLPPSRSYAPLPGYQLKRFSESASAGLVMAHYLGSVHASVCRRDTNEVDQLFSCRVPRRRDRIKVRVLCRMRVGFVWSCVSFRRVAW